MRTLGEFYRQRVLCLSKKELKKMKLPERDEMPVLKNDLFGWMVLSGREMVTCRSEYEARYIRVFWDAGVEEILVPKDDNYLKTVVEEVEKLKKRTDEIIDDGLDAILDPHVRERVRSEIYMELTK